MLLAKLKTFSGGAHLKDFKSLAAESPVIDFPLPAKVRLPVSQHFGKPARPIVNIGDLVKSGQLIAEAQGNFSSNIQASISGKITAIGKFPHPLGPESLAIEITSDARDEKAPGLSAADSLRLIQEAGIVGLGGAMFPAHIKLKPPADKKIEALIINGVECEPYVACDYRLMLEMPDKILAGLRIIRELTKVSRVYIGIEANKPKALSLLKQKTAGDKDITVVALAAKYPQGGEKQLIKAVLNREVPSGGLPFDVGVIVQNVATVAAIYDAVEKRQPLIERIITVTGSCIAKPANLRVRLGTLFGPLIDFCGLESSPGKIIMGGPMMGLAQYTADVPVIKGTNCILVIDKKEAALRKIDTCIRCGKCVLNCPLGLDPGKLATLIEKGRIAEALEQGAEDCIECGLCAYNCPSARNVVQLIKLAKLRKSMATKAPSH